MRTHPSFSRLHVRLWRFLLTLITVIIACAGAPPLIASASAQTAVFEGNACAADQIIVRFHPGVTSEAESAILSRVDAQQIDTFEMLDARLIQVAGESLADVLDSLNADPDVLYAEPNYVVYADVVPNDPLFDQLWGMQNTGQSGGTPDADIDATDAWNTHTGGATIVAIIDTGVDSLHADLNANIWHNPGEIPGNHIDDDANGYVDDIYGWDFVNNDNYPRDDNGHGTHCAGTIAAVGNNDIGVAGVCWSAQIMALKFLDYDGTGYSSDAILAIQYADRMGARISSNSWGGGPFSQALKEAIDSAGAHGHLFVAAAGNAGVNNDLNPHYPSSYTSDNIISVAATDHNDRLADEPFWASNYGVTSVDLAAPGVSIYSTLPGGGYGYKSGTSMATPHVSGAVALFWSRFPAMDAAVVKSRVLATVDAKVSLDGHVGTGGRLNSNLLISDPDSTRPGRIDDLAVTLAEGTRVHLSWTATGDDSSVGRATTYDIRYALVPIDSLNFASASQVVGEPEPQDAGTAESFIVTGLDFSTEYYFAVVAGDEWGNYSPPSNSPAAVTLGPPVASIDPDTLTDSLFYQGSSSHTLTLSNSGEGELLYSVNTSYSSTRHADLSLSFPPPSNTTNGEAALSGVSPSPSLLLPKSYTNLPLAGRDLNVLLIYADEGASVLTSILSSFPDIASVDTWYAAAGFGTIPPLSALIEYDAVVAWNNASWADMYAIGDVLADYLDQGGAVITTVDCWSAAQFASYGRYFQTPGYCPFASLGGAQFYSRFMTWFDADHPIMAGVTSLATYSFYNAVALTSDATLVASWDDGTPLVATNPGTVAINIWPGDGYYWSGDFPVLIHNALVHAVGTRGFVRVTPDAGEVSPHSDSTLSVSLEPGKLIAGDYQATIQIGTNDPLSPALAVHVDLNITGAPQIAVDPDTLDFGIVYLGYPRVLDFEIANDGTDSLYISDIVPSIPELTVDITSAALAVGEAVTVSVTLSPLAAGLLDVPIEIYSNDPDDITTACTILASVVEPPDIAVAPDSLGDSLLTGQTSVHTLALSNLGVYDLTFNLTVHEVNWVSQTYTLPATIVTEDVAAMDAVASAPQSITLPEFTVSLRDLSGKHIGFLNMGSWFYAIAADLEARGATVHNIGLPLPTSLLDSLDVLVVDDNVDYLTGTELTAVRSWLSAGHGLATMGDEAVAQLNILLSGTGIVEIYDGTFRSGYLTQILPHPITEDVDSVYSSSYGAYCSVSSPAETIVYDLNSRTHVAVSTLGRGRVVTAANEIASGSFLDAGDTRLFIHQMFDWLCGPVFVSAEPTSGVIPGGQTEDISVHFDPGILFGGDYFAELHIESNDPDEPQVIIPASLHVTGAPKLTVSPDSLDYGTLFVGQTSSAMIAVVNEGTDDLIVSDIHCPISAITASPSSFTLSPGADILVTVQFAPTDTLVLASSLIIESNDPTSPSKSVPVTGDAVLPPRITVTPLSIEDTLFIGDTTLHPIVISNIGYSDLIFRFSRHAGVPPTGTTARVLDSASHDPFTEALDQIASEHRSSGFMTASLSEDTNWIAGIGWLGIGNFMDTLPAGSSLTVDVKLIGEGFGAGDYYGYLLIAGNDPVSPNTYVPAYMHLDGIPDLFVDSTVVWDSAFVNIPTEQTLTVQNVGTDSLYISGISCGRPEFTFDLPNMELEHHSEVPLPISFLATDTGTYTDTLKIMSNDPEEDTAMVVLTATVRYPPEVSLNPDSIYLSLTTADSATESIAVRNDGLGLLNWQLAGISEMSAMTSRTGNPMSAGTAVEVISVSPQSGFNIPVGSQELIVVRVNTLPLGVGDYLYVLDFATNDPAARSVSVPVLVHAFVPGKGDTNIDDILDTKDILILAGFLYKEYPEPDYNTADVTCDRIVNTADLIYLIEYIFLGGPAPPCR